MSSGDMYLRYVSPTSYPQHHTNIDAFKRKTGLDIRPLIKDLVEWRKLEKSNPEFSDELVRGITLWEKPVDESGF